MNAVAIMAASGALACAVAAGAGLVMSRFEKRDLARRRQTALGIDKADARKTRISKTTGGLNRWGLAYAEGLTRKLFTGTTEPLSPSVRMKRAGKTRMGKRFLDEAASAGCDKDVTVSAFCEACFRLGAVGLLAGAVLGVAFSAELAALLALAGGLVGYLLPARAMRAARAERTTCVNRHLSEMLEVVALGMRSGLSFDLSFALYGSHFDNEFAHSCARACRRWSLGLTTREEALAQFANSYDSDQLKRVVDSIVRSLRFGTALAETLEDAAAQSRATYRASLEERVAKAPVKMMLPTGTLILPAMLLLVMGPILLELAGGFK